MFELFESLLSVLIRLQGCVRAFFFRALVAIGQGRGESSIVQCDMKLVWLLLQGQQREGSALREETNQ